MYEAYWKLSCKPFESTANPDFYYPSEAHQGAILKLRYAIESRRACAVLAGEAGVGKTLIIEALRRQLDPAFKPLVHVVFPQMNAAELLVYLADSLKAPASDRDQSIPSSLRRIERTLASGINEGRHAIIVIDEAHLIEDPSTLETLRLLMNIEQHGQIGCTMVLVGQVRLLSTLERMPSLEERLAIKCLLRPLNLEETESYVTHRLRAAGREEELFTSAAMETLFELTQGHPRRINRLCDLSLLVGFAEEQTLITPEQLAAVSEELITVAPE